MSVIKKIGKKSGNQPSSAFPILTPIGTDGTYVDMLSGLDLQEELKIGSSKTVTISNEYLTDGEDKKYVLVRENYGDKYILQVHIYEGQGNDDLVDNQNNSIVNENDAIDPTDDQNIYTNLRPYKITMVLYGIDQNYITGQNPQGIKALHSKVILFENGPDGQQIITESL